MPVSCTPTDLISASSQFCCITGETAQAVKLYLLRHIAGLDAMTPQQLLAASACWMTCVPQGAYKAVEAYLLCQIANSGGTPTVCAPQEGADSPVGAATPDFIGQLYHETGDDTYWRSTGLTNADWVEISGGGPCENIFTTQALSLDVFIFQTDDSLAVIELGSVTSVVSQFNISGFPALTTLHIQSIISIGADFIIESIPLTQIDLSALVTVATNTTIQYCASLTSVLVPNWVPTDGTTIAFNNCALDVTSVDLILHRCVLAGLTSATIDLSGGTNATPSVTGLADKATLIGNGCSVTTN